MIASVSRMGTLRTVALVLFMECVGGFVSPFHSMLHQTKQVNRPLVNVRDGLPSDSLLCNRRARTLNLAMRFAPLQTKSVVSAPTRAPLVLDDEGVWLPEDSFALSSQVVRVPGFLSKEEIAEIHSAAQTVKKAVGSYVRKLPVDLEHSDGLRRQPPWVTTYLQSLGYNRRLLPALLKKIEDKVVEIDSKHWNVLPDRKDFHVRVHEYHEVSPGGSLPALRHRDYGSLITIDMMLSDTNDFEGGVFQTLEADGSLVRHTFEQGDLILFLSHKFHSVTPVTKGRRNVMVMEFWQGNERRCGYRCTQHFGVCRTCDLRFPNGVTPPGDS